MKQVLDIILVDSIAIDTVAVSDQTKTATFRNDSNDTTLAMLLLCRRLGIDHRVVYCQLNNSTNISTTFMENYIYWYAN
jgi:hypothetical protein